MTAASDRLMLFTQTDLQAFLQEIKDLMATSQKPDRFLLAPTDYQSLLQEIRSIIVTEKYEKPMNYQEAAEYLGICEFTLRRRVKSRKIPPTMIHRIDGTIYFFRSELYQFIKKS